MNTYNIRELFNRKNKKTNIIQPIVGYFRFWKKLIKESNIEKTSDFDAFVAGYMIGINPTLRTRFAQELHEQKKLENKR